jgi:hypothetical protein
MTGSLTGLVSVTPGGACKMCVQLVLTREKVLGFPHVHFDRAGAK